MRSITVVSAVVLALSSFSNAAPTFPDIPDLNDDWVYSSTASSYAPVSASSGKKFHSETPVVPVSSSVVQSSTPVGPISSVISSPVVISVPTTYSPSVISPTVISPVSPISIESSPMAPVSTSAIPSSIIIPTPSVAPSSSSSKKHRSKYTTPVASSSPVSPVATSPIVESSTPVPESSSPVSPIQESSTCTPTVQVSSSESTSYLYATYIYATVTTWVPVYVTEGCAEASPVPTTTNCVDSPTGQSCFPVSPKHTTVVKSKTESSSVQSAAPQVSEAANSLAQLLTTTSTSVSVGFPGSLDSAALKTITSTSLSAAPAVASA